MNVTYDMSFCPRCGTMTTENANRLVTDNCGHRKCRRCLLADDECMECRQQMQENNKPPDIYIDATYECNALTDTTYEYNTLTDTTYECNVLTDATYGFNALADTTYECNVLTGANIVKSEEIRKKGRKVAPMPLHILRVEDDTSSGKHYYCTRCSRKFRSRSQQYYHLYCGNDAEKKYRCQQCDKAFSKNSHLKYHLEAHANKTYCCAHCNKSFGNRIVWRKHEKQHYTAPFKCVTCHKEFRSKYSLSGHIRKAHDDNELPYKCTECQKGYALKSTMKQHMQKHYDKKYACKYCDKRFQRNYTLKLHIRKHTKTDCFICGICFRKFSDATVLMRHVKLHEDTIKYRCSECDVTIIRKDNMLRHIRTIHPGQTFENCVEILQPQSNSNKQQKETERKSSSADITISEPKTVENSAVIKCIGNVEPMKIAPTRLPVNNISLVDVNLRPSHFSGEVDTLMSTTLSTLPNITVNEQSYEGGKNAVHKKVKKKYDPIKMYRKILASDCEDDESVYESDNETEEHENVYTQGGSMPVTSVDITSSEKRVSLTTSNFSETHWRKNFKYTYEYQEL